ncbi:hypothetical protein D3C72_344510 [compost metagenome]
MLEMVELIPLYELPMFLSASMMGRSMTNKRQQGFTYLSALILVAIISMVAVSTVQVGTFLQRRAAEEELLKIGIEFRNAFISYASSTPAGQSKLPSNLEELLRDPRYPNTRRHLRKLYADPITGKSEWLPISARTGPGIAGVSSTSNLKPIKTGNFDSIFQEFEKATTYQDWQFVVNFDHSLDSRKKISHRFQD